MISLPGLIPCGAPERLAEVGVAALEHFSRRLDLAEQPRIGWFFEARSVEHGVSTEPTMSGCTIKGSNEIWISISQSPLQVWRAVAHELCHVVGMAEGRASVYERQAHIAESFYRWGNTQLGAA